MSADNRNNGTMGIYSVSSNGQTDMEEPPVPFQESYHGDEGLLERTTFHDGSPEYTTGEPLYPAAAIGGDRASRLEGPRPGRYEGSDGNATLVLRCDDASLSGDIFRGRGDEQVWLASFRATETSARPNFGESTLAAVDRFGVTAHGRLALRSEDTDLFCRLTFSARLDGLPTRRSMQFLLRHVGSRQRSLALEIETEAAVAPPPTVVSNGRQLTIETCLAEAGFDVFAGGQADVLPGAPSEGWSEKQFFTLMHDFSQMRFEQAAFGLRLLWLSRANRERLFGVMFDVDEMPRQGLAVFADTIRSFAAHLPVAVDVKLLQTSIHEIGHALNLRHRFEREIGRADSTSFMNYDWRYSGVGGASAFWNAFRFSFDDDEIAFLRHGPYQSLVPGGAAFGSARYFVDGEGGYSPYRPERPLQDFALDLLLPAVGPVHAYGQPVILGTRLTNRTSRALRVPRSLLDPKAGFLEFSIRRRSQANASEFRPLISRCYDESSATSWEVLPPGGSLEDNVNLVFGRSGFPFAEPGDYEITAFLVLSTPQHERIARSPVTRIRVAAPKCMVEEREAYVLGEAATGRVLALAGDPTADTTMGRLAEIMERRDAVGRDGDGVSAAIARVLMFYNTRKYVRLDLQGRSTTTTPDTSSARNHARKLDGAKLTHFDAVTAAATTTFRDRLLAEH